MGTGRIGIFTISIHLHLIANNCSAVELAVDHGTVTPSSESPSGTDFELVCDSGYSGDTTGTLECSPTGSWKNKPAGCTGKISLFNYN